MDRRGAYAFIAAVLADIAVFAAIAEDDHRLALQRRFDGRLDAQQGRVVESGLAAISQVVNRANQPLAVGRVIQDQPGIVAESDDGYGIVRTQRLQIAARGRLRLGQRLIRHAAAGIDHQYAGEVQIIIGDILDAGDFGLARQVPANGKILDIQARNQLPG